MSEKVGRPLTANENVHHIDGNKQNNEIDNLKIITRSEHTRLHNKTKRIIRGDKGRITGFVNLDEIVKEDVD